MPLQHQAYNASETDITKKSGQPALMSEAGGDEVHEMSENPNMNASQQYKAMGSSELDGVQTGAMMQKSAGAGRGRVHELGTE